MGDDLFSFSNIHGCYLKCRRGKRNTINALRFEMNLEENLCRLERELKTKSYRPARSVRFIVNKPKAREIFAADFKDRIVHHVLVDYLEKIFEPKFIFDSFACRRGKGTHAAVQRLQKFARQATRNGTGRAFYLQMDLRNYFVSIDKGVLLGLIRRRISNPDVLWLAETIISNDCAKNYVYKGNPGLINSVPPHKSLLNATENRGLPIGNLTSQFFANVYLNELDQFVKRDLKVKHYIRYVDDFILLSESEEQLAWWKGKIAEFVHEKLNLEIHPVKQRIAPISNGMDFLGYIVRPGYMLVRRRVVHNCRAQLRRIEEAIGPDRGGALKEAPLTPVKANAIPQGVQAGAVAAQLFSPAFKEECKDRATEFFLRTAFSTEGGEPGITVPAGQETIRGSFSARIAPVLFPSWLGRDCTATRDGAHIGAEVVSSRGGGVLQFSPDLVKKAKASLSSYLAHFALADSRRLENSIWRRFQFADEFMRHAHLIEPHYFPCVQEQYDFFKRGLAGEPFILFFQMGRFYRFFGEDAAAAGKLLGLKVFDRGGKRCTGFPVQKERKYAGIAARSGCCVYVVNQLAGGGFSHKQRPRVLTRKYYPSVPSPAQLAAPSSGRGAADAGVKSPYTPPQGRAVCLDTEPAVAPVELPAPAIGCFAEPPAADALGSGEKATAMPPDTGAAA